MIGELSIKPGDIFSAGPHRFLCGDIEKDDVCKLLDIPKEIYMVYSDPPWNPGNAKMWRTLSKRDGETGRKVEWNNFVNRFCVTANQPHPNHIFVEMGVRQSSDFISSAMCIGFSKFKREWNVFYNYTHPNKLLYFSDIGGFTGNPEGLKNESMTKHVFERIYKQGEIVFDPCTGLGMTARMAHRFGMVFYGNELNPLRLKKTLEWMSKYYEIIKFKSTPSQ